MRTEQILKDVSLVLGMFILFFLLFTGLMFVFIDMVFTTAVNLGRLIYEAIV